MPQAIPTPEEIREGKRQGYIAALRQLADFFEAHPAIPMPYPTEYIFCSTREEFLLTARELIRGGKITKSTRGSEENGDFRVMRDFGGIEVQACISRSKLCRVVQPAVYDCPPLLEGVPEEGEEGGNVPNPLDQSETYACNNTICQLSGYHTQSCKDTHALQQAAQEAL